MSGDNFELVGGNGEIKGEISFDSGQFSVTLNENSGLKRMHEVKRHRWVCYNLPGGHWDYEATEKEAPEYILEAMDEQMKFALPASDHEHNFKVVELPYDPSRIYHQCLGTFEKDVLGKDD